MPQVFYLMYAYANKFSYDRTKKEDYTEGEHCLSSATINDWFNYFREAVVTYQKNREALAGKIGGSGKIVQIDESKFGKRKYNKGRRIEGHWILGMILDGSEDLRLEVCPVNLRSTEILVPLIKKHVAEGTIIHTDYWRAYDCLGDHGYIHHKVNHRHPDNPFVAEDGTHTQRIESQWRVLKRFFSKDNYNNRSNIGDLLYEFLWRILYQSVNYVSGVGRRKLKSPLMRQKQHSLKRRLFRMNFKQCKISWTSYRRCLRIIVGKGPVRFIYRQTLRANGSNSTISINNTAWTTILTHYP